MKTALLFPGQGSQKVGMGKALAEQSQAARRVFEEADEALGASISRLCWEGPAADLTRTANTQPAILTCSIAVLRAAQAEGELHFDVAAGHSLGEWSALVAVGALSLADAVRLVRLRGAAMQEAVPEGQGAMAAILGLERPAVEALCAEAAEGEVCQAANFNGGGQIVVSGAAAAVTRVVALAKERGAMRAVPLQVSAPFHSALMSPAAEKVRAALAGVRVAPLAVPVVANATAEPNQDAERVKTLLVRQVTAPVLWEQSVQRMAQDGVTRGIELGAGAVLRGLIKRISKDITVTSVGEPGDLAGLRAQAG